MSKNISKKYHLSGSFEKFLSEISGGFLTSQQFEEVYQRFEKCAEQFYFDHSSEANLIRLLSALYDKKSFLVESLKYDHHLEIVCGISSLSNYLTDVVVRHPEYLYILFDQQILAAELNEEKLLTEIHNSVENFKTLQSKTRMLRNIKRKYLLKIGTADILGFNKLETTTSQLSLLAKTLSSVLFKICYDEIQNKYNVKLENNYTLCSLGKLGGNELNYSSDIDLILFYESNFEIPGIKKEYHEVITEALTLFIKEATTLTPESYLYRVDFRLRPDGRNSLLCRTEADYLKYYETRGEDWERQMLVKLGFIGGSNNLFDHFKNYLDGFIYPQTLRNSVIDTIKKMKRSIELRLADKKNIKLVPGGIRDIEFTVQALQLMSGGKIPKLKTGNTLEALRSLLDAKLLDQNEYTKLSDSYKLYRKVEHFVQLMNDKQTHSIPDSPELKNKLSQFLGYSSEEEFIAQIEECRVSVRTIYKSVIGESVDENDDNINTIEFSDEKKAKTNIEYLRYGLTLIGEKQFDKRTVKLFQDIESLFFEYLKTISNPDIVIVNFARVIKNISLPSVWYSAFQDKLFLNSFLKVCSRSQRAIDSIAISPQLADLFLSKEVFQQIDVENNTFNLAETKFILSVQHACGIISFPEFSNILSSKIEQVITIIISEQNLSYEFFVGGLGSFGNDELSFGSDIDLIVVTKQASDNHKAEKDFQKFLNELKANLSPFEVDFRLRPEGKSSPLVWDIGGYEKYINSRMRVWEFQAISKLRPIYGSHELFNQLVRYVTDKLKTFDKDSIENEILQLYNSKLASSFSNQKKISLKASPGALITIDTIVSLFITTNTSLYKKIVGENSLERIQYISSQLAPGDFDKLKKNYILLKNIQVGLQNLLNQSKSTIPSSPEKIELLTAYFEFPNRENFLEVIDKVLDENLTLLKSIIGKL